MYALFDRKLREYGQLVQSNNDEAVKRNLRDGLTGTNSIVEKHPSDFDLYCLGEFDTESGVITPASVPKLVVNVDSLIVRPSTNGDQNEDR